MENKLVVSDIFCEHKDIHIQGKYQARKIHIRLTPAGKKNIKENYR